MHNDRANVLSRHRTTDGMVVYARGEDGELQVWLHRWDEAPTLLTEGGGPPGARRHRRP